MSAAEAVATVGDNCIDVYVSGTNEATYVGGNAVNVAVGVVRQGREAAYFGAVGHDEHGRRVRRALAAAGVDGRRVVQCADRPTGVTRIRLLEGERVFEQEDFGASGTYAPDRDALAELGGYGAVHLGWLADPGSVRRRLASTPTLLSQDCAVSGGFDGLDVAFCSAPARDDAARQVAVDAIRGGARLAVVTCGAQGCLAFDGRSWWAQEAYADRVVDTTGAGDSFIAAFLHGRLDGLDVPGGLDLASRAAAGTVAEVGAWPQPSTSLG